MADMRTPYRRKLQQAIDLLETAGKYVVEFQTAYEECCPELSTHAVMLVNATIELQSALRNLRESF